MARLRSIRIAGWKSIQEIDPPLELGPVNVLIGANGSGKSNFVSFFKFLHEVVEQRFQTYIAQVGGADSVLHEGPKTTPTLQAKLEIGDDTRHCRYSFVATHDVQGSLLLIEEQLILEPPGYPGPRTISISVGGQRESHLRQLADQGDQSTAAVLKVLGQCRIFHFHDTSATAKIRLAGYIEANQHLYSDGGNLAALLYLYQQTKPAVYRQVIAAIRKVMPAFDDFVLEPQRLNPKNILLNWKQEGSEYLFGPHQLSDGTLRAMALITLFLQPEEDLPDLILVDEPELGLHPHAIEIIAGLIRAASLNTQLILTTQSTTFLDHFEPGEVIVVDNEAGHSVFRRLEVEELEDWMDGYSVGELWEKNVLGGGPLL
jgi:predicted ATPase